MEALANSHDVKPELAKNMPHLEIAAIFLSYCTSYFLKSSGQLAFVLPRSFFSADQHDQMRNGSAKDVKLTEVWDLENVSPLFNIPSCVFFVKNEPVLKKISKEGLKGLSFQGRLRKHNSSWEEAKPKIKEAKTQYFYSKQGKSSALTQKAIKATTKINPYKKQFNQGATIVPRTFYFIEAEKGFDIYRENEPKVRTLRTIISDAKKPWKDITFSKVVNSNYVFITALSRSILPFSLFKPDNVILPIQINSSKDRKEIILQSPKEIQKLGFSKAFKWFEDCENVWSIHRTEKNKANSSYHYLNWQNKLTSQNLNAPYLVLYNASAKDANATIVKREDYELEFIVESVSYVFYTDNLEEAYYLTSILNSAIPNLMMKDFQAKGLFGARHVHKKILDVYFPTYDEKNKIHKQLAVLGKEAHEKTKIYLTENPPPQNLSAMHLGRLRLAIKKHLAEEMIEIDHLVEKIIK